jgi:hypothetical protein
MVAHHGAERASPMDAPRTLQEMVRDALVEWDGRRIATGRPFVRAAAATFDAYRHRGVARHSAAGWLHRYCPPETRTKNRGAAGASAARPPAERSYDPGGGVGMTGAQRPLVVLDGF